MSRLQNLMRALTEMDDDLRELERLWKASPHDASIQRRLEQALLRSRNVEAVKRIMRQLDNEDVRVNFVDAAREAEWTEGAVQGGLQPLPTWVWVRSQHPASPLTWQDMQTRTGMGRYNARFRDTLKQVLADHLDIVTWRTSLRVYPTSRVIQQIKPAGVYKWNPKLLKKVAASRNPKRWFTDQREMKLGDYLFIPVPGYAISEQTLRDMGIIGPEMGAESAAIAAANNATVGPPIRPDRADIRTELARLTGLEPKWMRIDFSPAMVPPNTQPTGALGTYYMAYIKGAIGRMFDPSKS